MREGKARPNPLRSRATRGSRRVVALQERLADLSRELEEELDRFARDPRASGARPLSERIGAGVREIAERIDEVRGSERADDFGFDPEFEELVAPLFVFLYRTWWRVETEGIEQVPAEGAAILVGNHSGTMFPWDGAMLKVALRLDHPARRELRPLVENFVFRLPFIGSFMTRTGGVRACPENAEALVRRNEIVAVFPEGVRGMGKPFRRRYRLERFGRGGFVTLALRTGAPIVPVAILGAEEIHPLLATWPLPARLLGLPYFPITPTFPWLGLGGLVPLPTKWTIRFGEPIRIAGRFRPEQADDRLLTDRLTIEVREQVQDLVDEGLRQRRSVFV